MCEYIKWIFNPDNINTNIFTVISVVLSGLISWEYQQFISLGETEII